MTLRLAIAERKLEAVQRLCEATLQETRYGRHALAGYHQGKAYLAKTILAEIKRLS